jgi:hypothetical protein
MHKLKIIEMASPVQGTRVSGEETRAATLQATRLHAVRSKNKIDEGVAWTCTLTSVGCVYFSISGNPIFSKYFFF